MSIRMIAQDLYRLQQEVEKLEKELAEKRSQLEKQAAELTARRKKVLPEIEAEVNGMLKVLGIPNAVFRVEHHDLGDFSENGKDEVVGR